MIVRRHANAQLLITQPDHAALAGQIMRRWRANGLPDNANHALILAAVDEHDNGWREVDATPIIDAGGAILDFIHAPEDVRRGVWPRGIVRLHDRPYVAALVAQHALHIYRRFRDGTGWAPFFTSIEALRERYLQASAPATLEQLLADYAFVRLGDLASLTFCNGWTTPQNDEFGYAMWMDGARLVITPDPFEGATIPIEVTARELSARRYDSTADAKRAFDGAPIVALQGTAAGAHQRN